MILVIDNYDSFVENLARYARELGHKTVIYRNDAITLEKIEEISPSHIILSPGPCTPNESGICIDLIKKFGSKIPILGVCLGHQAIGQTFGAKVTKAIKPMHGKSSKINHNKLGIFKDTPKDIKVARYHSLVINDITDCLEITATSYENEIMAVSHKKYPIYGVQFHLESVLTEHGYEMLKNFLNCNANIQNHTLNTWDRWNIL